MAYISTEKVAEIRNDLKKAFPDFKFSITRQHYTSVNVDIMKSPLDFSVDFVNHSNREHIQLNHYYLDNYSHADTLKKIYQIVNEGNFDESDPMTDYFHVGWYCHINIGKWDKPYICTKKS